MTDKEALKLALEKIATVNAMDYEYQAWAREALEEQPAQPYKGIADYTNQVTNGRVQIDPVTGDVGIGTPSQQPEQEPEWYHGVDKHGCNRFYHKTEARTSEFNTPLYTTPPKREWVGLTDEEIWETVSRIGTSDSDVNPYAKLADARAIEAKLKEKNT
jgi:hypothetical protein